MGMSEYLRQLRAQVGHALLVLPSVTVLPRDDEGRVLLVRNTDTGRWMTIGGLVEPGEAPVEAAVREAREEAGVDVALGPVLGVVGGPGFEVRYPNGDVSAYVATVYDARVVSGDAAPDGQETTEIGWFSGTELGTLDLDPFAAATLRELGNTVARRGAHSPRVLLTKPTRGDQREFLAAVAASRELHEPWVFPPTDRATYRGYLDRVARPDCEGWLVRGVDGDALVGVVNLNNIVHGTMESAALGYYAFVPHAGRGLMREALALAIDEAFGRLGLHRVEANVQPENVRSIALVRGLGFVQEGYSRRYLKIAGDWRDHERWALVAEDWPARA
ncbi:MAG TPA: GNAT family N-acetyltransferase [Acidimicrobiia bacterium]|nr:GNAT family N-acetyltransferase [Acidimicrobiia bacterium]